MLGGAGALPFVVLAIAAWTVAGSIGPVAIDGILTYGAVILSFIGGAHWGFASVPHFSRVFKQHFGLAPGEFRQKKSA